MPAPLTCARCGAEVRYGVRDDITAWHHREPVDHHTVLGAWVPVEDLLPWSQEHSEASGSSEDAVPAPEVTSTRLEPRDRRITGGAVTVRNLLEKTDWEWWFTYARGPVTHGATGALLRIADSLVVRARLADPRRIAVASWHTGSKGTLEFTSGWTADLNPKTNNFEIEKANSTELRAFLRGET